jgi:hypothetical protein
MNASSFTNPQHESRPSHGQDRIPEERQQIASDRQGNHVMETNLVGELDLMPPGDNPAANSSPIQVQTVSGADKPSVSDISDLEKDQSTQSSLDSHLEWKASWRTQTVVVGFFLLCKCRTNPHYADRRLLILHSIDMCRDPLLVLHVS